MTHTTLPMAISARVPNASVIQPEIGPPTAELPTRNMVWIANSRPCISGRARTCTSAVVGRRAVSSESLRSRQPSQ